MASIKNHPFWNFTFIGVIIAWIPMIIYIIIDLQTNVWLSNGMTKSVMLSLTLTFGFYVCFYSYVQLRKGVKDWRYKITFIVFIIGFSVIMDIDKYGHTAENSPVVLELYKVENIDNIQADETIIVFRENGTCRYSIESTSEKTSYLETTYVQMDSIYTINAPENTQNVIPHQLKNDNGLYYGQIHLWKGSKKMDVYYKASSGIFNIDV